MRIVILGCGTGVGKTRVSVALLRELVRRQYQAVGVKPIESGLTIDEESLRASDAQALAAAGSRRARSWIPVFNFADPISPHLAARRTGVTIDIQRAAHWVQEAERELTPDISSHSAIWSVVETAGGAFSPLSERSTNFELGQALDPSIWVLVAADALGVLHDVSAALQAMRARGRIPDHVVLSGAREPDASTGSNAQELAALGTCKVSAVLERDDDRGIATLVDALCESREPL